MRIIAGEFRGRTILSPADGATRPITDRAKQSLFDVLREDVEGSRVIDCFAGTGSMGLECLSRGAIHATFYESHKPAVTLLRKNITALGARNKSEIIAGDVFTVFNHLDPIAADLIFFDPPYRYLRDRPDDLRQLAQEMVIRSLSFDGLIVFRHDAADELELPGLRRTDRRQYGAGMVIDLLRKAG